MSLPLTAPSSVRRSKKRCAQYVETHDQLRREVEEMKEAERQIDIDLDRELENFFQFNIGGIV